MSSPAFGEALKALLRIKPDHPFRYMAVRIESLERAFEVSPTFAELKPEFHGMIGEVWTDPVSRTFPFREYGPWFMWALRNATANAGYYKDPASTNAFYRKFAHEINQAADEGRIPSRFVLSGFLDPGAVSRVHHVRHSIPLIAQLFLLRHHKVMVRADESLMPWMDSLYQEMVFRRPQPQPALHPETNNIVIENTISARLAVATQNFIGANHVYLVLGLAWAGLAAFLLLIFFHRRWRFSDPLIATVLLLGTTIAVRIVFFAFLDATWWMGGYERYLVPVMPLTNCFLVLLIYQAIALCRKPNGGTTSVSSLT
jgi:hypothetical protein